MADGYGVAATSIVIPAFNESGSIEAVVRAAHARTSSDGDAAVLAVVDHIDQRRVQCGRGVDQIRNGRCGRSAVGEWTIGSNSRAGAALNRGRGGRP